MVRGKISAGALDSLRYAVRNEDVDKSFETAEALTGKVLQVGKNKFIRFVA